MAGFLSPRARRQVRGLFGALDRDTDGELSTTERLVVEEVLGAERGDTTCTIRGAAGLESYLSRWDGTIQGNAEAVMEHLIQTVTATWGTPSRPRADLEEKLPSLLLHPPPGVLIPEGDTADPKFLKALCTASADALRLLIEHCTEATTTGGAAELPGTPPPAADPTPAEPAGVPPADAAGGDGGDAAPPPPPPPEEGEPPAEAEEGVGPAAGDAAGASPPTAGSAASGEDTPPPVGDAALCREEQAPPAESPEDIPHPPTSRDVQRGMEAAAAVRLRERRERAAAVPPHPESPSHSSTSTSRNPGGRAPPPLPHQPFALLQDRVRGLQDMRKSLEGISLHTACVGPVGEPFLGGGVAARAEGMPEGILGGNLRHYHHHHHHHHSHSHSHPQTRHGSTTPPRHGFPPGFPPGFSELESAGASPGGSHPPASWGGVAVGVGGGRADPMQGRGGAFPIPVHFSPPGQGGRRQLLYQQHQQRQQHIPDPHHSHHPAASPGVVVVPPPALEDAACRRKQKHPRRRVKGDVVMQLTPLEARVIKLMRRGAAASASAAAAAPSPPSARAAPRQQLQQLQQLWGEARAAPPPQPPPPTHHRATPLPLRGVAGVGSGEGGGGGGVRSGTSSLSWHAEVGYPPSGTLGGELPRRRRRRGGSGGGGGGGGVTSPHPPHPPRASWEWVWGCDSPDDAQAGVGRGGCGGGGGGGGGCHVTFSPPPLEADPVAAAAAAVRRGVAAEGGGGAGAAGIYFPAWRGGGGGGRVSGHVTRPDSSRHLDYVIREAQRRSWAEGVRTLEGQLVRRNKGGAPYPALCTARAPFSKDTPMTMLT